MTLQGKSRSQSAFMHAAWIRCVDRGRARLLPALLLLILISFDPVIHSFGSTAFTLQIGAYPDEKSAHRIVKKLRGSGIDCGINKGSRLFKVRCGLVITRNEAVLLQEKIRALGHRDSIIVSTAFPSMPAGSNPYHTEEGLTEQAAQAGHSNASMPISGNTQDKGRTYGQETAVSGTAERSPPLQKTQAQGTLDNKDRRTDDNPKVQSFTEKPDVPLSEPLSGKKPSRGIISKTSIIIVGGITLLIALLHLIATIFLRKKGMLQAFRVSRIMNRNKDLVEDISLGNYSPLHLDEIKKKLFKIGNDLYIELILDRAAELPEKPLSNIHKIYDATGITDRYIDAFKNSRSWKKRAFAAEKLGQIRSVKAVPHLIAIVRDVNNEDEDVRSVALRALGKIRHKEAIPFLIEALGSPETWLPPRIGEILYNIGDESVEPLRKELSNFESESGRGWAAEILGWLHAKDAVPSLIESLFDVSPEVRAKVAGALGKIKSERAIIKLTELLVSEPVAFVRTRVSQALGEIGHPSVIHYLVNILKDPEWWVRVRAVEALEHLGKKSVPSLLVAMEDEDTEVRRRAALALERIGYVEEILKEYGQDTYKPELRKILFLVAQAGVIESLSEKLAHSEGHLRKRIVRLLGEAGSRESSEPLIDLLRTDPEWTLKARVIQSIGKVGAKEAIPLLIDHLKDSEYWVRRSSVEALAMLDASDHSVQIASILEDPNPYARESALRALSMLRVTSHWERIEKMLYDPAPKVRSTALRVMRELGITTEREIILNVLAESSEEVRIEAIRYFSATVDADVLNNMIRLLPLGSADLRRELVEYIRRIKPKDFQSVLSLLNTQNLGNEILVSIIEIASIIKDRDAYSFIIDFTGSVDECLREAAYRAAAAFGFDDNARLFEKALFDPSRAVRAIVLACVGPNSNDNFLDKAKTLSNDPDENVRLALILAFGASGLSQFRPLIIKMLDDPSLKVVAGAFIALACFSDPSFLEVFYSHKNLAMIKKEIRNIMDDTRLTHVVEEIRTKAEKINNLEVALLFAGNDNKFAHALIKKLKEALDPVIRIQAIEMLKIIATPDLFTSVLSVMKKDPHADVRIQAMNVVASIGREEEVIAALSSSLIDPAPDVRNRAAEWLGEYKSPRALESLLHVLDTPDREFREIVTTSLSHLLSGEHAKVAELVKRVPETKTRKIGMAWLMGKSRKRGSLKFLVNLLADSDPEVRAAALGALGKFKKKQTLNHVKKLIYDPNERVRAAAVNAVSSVGGDRAFEIIVSALHDIDDFVRTRAVIGLARINMKQTMSILRAKVKNFPEIRPHLSGLCYAAGESYEEYSTMTSLAISIIDELSHTQEMLNVFTQSSDRKQRMHAFRVLAITKKGSDQKFLADAMKDPLPEIRKEAKKLVKAG